MENYVVIDGERFDFVEMERERDCSQCALEPWCEYEDTPCSVFNKIRSQVRNRIFVKHENK